jgi:ribokinase
MPGPSIPLLVLGDFAWDMLIRTNTELLPGGDAFGEIMLAPGGSAANVAVWAARCGLETTFIGKIGRDRFGQLAVENLADEKVPAHFVYTDEHRTAAVAVWIDHHGKRSMVSGQGADFYLLPSELPVKMIKQARHLHLTAWSFFTDPPRAAARQAAKLANEAGATLSFDPGSFQMIRQIGAKPFLANVTDLSLDIFFPNLEEGQVLSHEKEPENIARKLAEIFPSAIIALKLDAQGAMILEEGELTYIPPGTDNLIDATGAGDSFAGAFLAKYLKHGDATAAAHFAVRVSAWVVNHIGARAWPDRQLKQLISK